MWPRKLKRIPAVKAVMTPFPYSVGLLEPIEHAREMMSSHRIHHLPVMDEGVLVGVIGHRDLQRIEGTGPVDEGEPLLIKDVPRDEAYVVDLSAPLDQVLQQMVEQHLGAALVVKDDRLAGIFTLTDACRCFAECLTDQFPAAGGDEAA